MNVEQAISHIVAVLRDKYRPERVILFGSRVSGIPDRDSDLDLLIVKESRKREVERIREVSRLLRPRPLPLDILVKTPREIEARLALGDEFLRDIIEHGKVVYERPAGHRVGRQG